MSVQSKNRWTNDVGKYDLPHLRLRQVAELIKQINPTSYTDLGCAKGTLRLLTPEILYKGCDFIVPKEKYDFDFYPCDFNNDELPHQINESELIVCSGLLEYIDNLELFLTKINSALKNDGKLLVTYFNMNHISRIIDLLAGKSFKVHPDWRGFYSPNDFIKILTKTGFLIDEIFTSSQSFKTSPSVSNTTDVKTTLNRHQFYSKHLAHQLIFVCKKSKAVE